MTGKDLVNVLRQNGWTIDRTHGSHYIMVKDNRTVSVPVHSGKDLPVGTLNDILKRTGSR